jgi:hypothetical protein
LLTQHAFSQRSVPEIRVVVTLGEGIEVGDRFAPRYRNLRKKAESLVGFRHPKHYADSLITPSRKVLESLICSEWPNIQRIMASLAQKDVTQATVVRKLSAYARQNRTKKALAELDSICRTLYKHLSRLPTPLQSKLLCLERWVSFPLPATSNVA